MFLTFAIKQMQTITLSKILKTYTVNRVVYSLKPNYLQCVLLLRLRADRSNMSEITCFIMVFEALTFRLSFVLAVRRRGHLRSKTWNPTGFISFSSTLRLRMLAVHWVMQWQFLWPILRFEITPAHVSFINVFKAFSMICSSLYLGPHGRGCFCTDRRGEIQGVIRFSGLWYHTLVVYLGTIRWHATY